jgi:hypothetical protein
LLIIFVSFSLLPGKPFLSLAQRSPLKDRLSGTTLFGLFISDEKKVYNMATPGREIPMGFSNLKLVIVELPEVIVRILFSSVPDGETS